ncbi:MAG: LLM class flavin-dependent oxidoreductase, partial [Thaumarchaeota archaeon]|nr:LLM class flavin-dependent oxidoreductase [Nitrososphaerota archaeon]
ILNFRGSGNIVHEAPRYEKLDWPKTVHYTKTVEAMGYDSAWVVDHFMLGLDDAIFESWTSLSYLAAITSKIQLGPFVLCNSYRNPALVGKMATTLDILSNGRLYLGVGAGWHVDEYKAYGYRFPPPRERVESLRDTLLILRSMFSEVKSSFSGKYASIEGAVNNPQPVQRPRPPIMVGAYGDKMLKLIAELADGWCVSSLPGDPSDASPEVFRKRSGYLDSCCSKIGRNPEGIDRIWTGHVIVASDKKTADERISFTRDKIAREVDSGKMLRVDPDAMIGTFIRGTPSDCLSRMEELCDAGATNFVLYFDDFPLTKNTELFSKEVWAKLAS